MKNKQTRVVFSVKLDGNRETQPTPPIFVKTGPLNVQGINVFEGEEGNEAFVQAFRVREAPFEKYLEESIQQAIANERKRIADEVKGRRIMWIEVKDMKMTEKEKHRLMNMNNHTIDDILAIINKEE